jgi:hypothetical protein
MTGGSGFLRFDLAKKSVGVSADGGESYPLLLGAGRNDLALDGSATVHGETDLSISADNEMFVESAGLIDVKAGSQCTWTVLDGGIQFEAQRIGVTSADLTMAAFGDTRLFPFNSSGQLFFRFGPHQGWYSLLTHTSQGGPFNDGAWPLPHSGQIVQMILENAPGGGGGAQGLQVAYDADPTIVTDGTNSATVIADDHVGARFSPIGETAGIPISLSGFVQRPTTASPNIGDLFMFQTGFGTDGRPQRKNATTLAEAQALSLGLGHMSLNTGSGIVELSIGSGITQLVTIVNTDIADDSDGTDIVWSTAGNQFPDRHYHVTSTDEVVFLVPGFYQANYAASMTKTTGTQRQSVRVELRINGSRILGSKAFAYLRNTTDNVGTANGVCLFNAEAGDILTMNVVKLTNMSEGCRSTNRETTLVLEYKGPPRGGVSLG